MKLNLLPTYVGRGKQLVVSIVAGVLMILVCFGISFVMVKSAQTQLDDVTAQAKAYEDPVQKAIDYSNKVDQIVAPLHDLVRNINLANEMKAHNTVYPDFYDQVMPYIPNFYRVTSMQANPSDPNNCT